MMDNIDKDEIRRAIDRLQIEHPAHFTFDLTMFDNGTDFAEMQRAIDVVAKKSQEDADLHIICEMAKLYLDGVTPTVERPHGEWFHAEEYDYLDEDGVEHFHIKCPNCGFLHDCFDCHTAQYNFCPNCGASMRKEGDENG